MEKIETIKQDYIALVNELLSYDTETILEILASLADAQILLSESICEHTKCEYAIAHSQKIYITLLNIIIKSEYNSSLVQY